ncbi:hypothetical protein EON82_09065 [bacterium]|nr:MAG: hypothetical protein EON82_09065 [bacterium]
MKKNFLFALLLLVVIGCGSGGDPSANADPVTPANAPSTTPVTTDPNQPSTQPQMSTAGRT